MISTAVFLALCVSVYLMAAFMSLEFNPLRWHEFTRGMVVFALALFTLVFAMHLVDRYEDRSDAQIERSARIHRAMEHMR